MKSFYLSKRKGQAFNQSDGARDCCRGGVDGGGRCVEGSLGELDTFEGHISSGLGGPYVNQSCTSCL